MYKLKNLLYDWKLYLRERGEWGKEDEEGYEEILNRLSSLSEGSVDSRIRALTKKMNDSRSYYRRRYGIGRKVPMTQVYECSLCGGLQRGKKVDE